MASLKLRYLGNFVLTSENKCQLIAEKNNIGEILWFDGKDVVLKNGCRLVPDGWIYFPPDFKIKFDMGKEVSEKISL